MKLGARRSTRYVAAAAGLAVAGAAGAFLMWGLPEARPPAGAPTVEIDALLAQADAVVAARVVAVTPRWSAGRIVSDVDVDVERTLKGPGVAALTLTHAGGSIDGIGMRVEGAERFVPGERALLFVRQVGGESRLVERARGKLPLADDGTGKTVVVVPTSAGWQQRPLDEVAAGLGGRP